MASITEVRTSEAPRPLPVFSQAIKANGFVFCSGSIGFDKDTMQLVDGGIKAQTVLIPAKSPKQTNNLMGFTGTNTQKPCGCSKSCRYRF
jgi:Endoribonuclease L-PSP